MGGATARGSYSLSPLPILTDTPTVGAPTPHILAPSPCDAIQPIGRYSADRFARILAPPSTTDIIRSFRCHCRIGGRCQRERLPQANHRTISLFQKSNHLRCRSLPARLCPYLSPNGGRCQNLRHRPSRGNRNETMGGSPRRSRVRHKDRYRSPKHLRECDRNQASDRVRFDSPCQFRQPSATRCPSVHEARLPRDAGPL